MNAAPDEWEDGYITFGKWPTADMVKNEETGVWSYTIPLPSGSWNYRFYIGGADGAEVSDFTDAVCTWDPNNVPTLYDYEADDFTNDELLSSVYVPYDAEKQANSLDFSLEAPRDDQHGTVLFDEVEVSDGSQASFGIYLPYGYDKNREEAYPIFVLLHGGGGTESSWINQGALPRILDNMIAEGKLEPTIVITPNCSDYPSEQFLFNRPMILSNVLEYMLPYMVENYHASADRERRAFGGLSMGGATTYYALFNHTEEFQYYFPMSGFISKEYEPDYTKESLKDVTICVASGITDFCLADTREDFMSASNTLTIMENFTANGIAYTCDIVKTGHDWVTWRQNLPYMLENVLWK